MESTIIRIHCNACGQMTNHTALASVNVSGEDKVEHWTDTYQTLQCVCGYVTFRKQEWHSAWQGPNSEPFYKFTCYPSPIYRSKPKWLTQLDEKLVEVLDEVYSALQHDLRFIAAVGIRTVLDMAMVDKVGDLGKNSDKYNALIKKDFLTEDQSKMLKAVIDTGDAAAHRGYKPETIDLKRALDLAESIMEKMYITGQRDAQLLVKAKKLKLKVPPRPTKA